MTKTGRPSSPGSVVRERSSSTRPAISRSRWCRKRRTSRGKRGVGCTRTPRAAIERSRAMPMTLSIIPRRNTRGVRCVLLNYIDDEDYRSSTDTSMCSGGMPLPWPIRSPTENCLRYRLLPTTMVHIVARLSARKTSAAGLPKLAARDHSISHLVSSVCEKVHGQRVRRITADSDILNVSCRVEVDNTLQRGQLRCTEHAARAPQPSWSSGRTT
jgi:hypothetical protein